MEPAFPSENPPFYQGLSIRDYFAAVALAGLCAHSGSYGVTNGPGDLAERSFQLADAMLAARETKEVTK